MGRGQEAEKKGDVEGRGKMMEVSGKKMMEEELARSGACWGYIGMDEDGEIGKNRSWRRGSQ